MSVSGKKTQLQISSKKMSEEKKIHTRAIVWASKVLWLYLGCLNICSRCKSLMRLKDINLSMIQWYFDFFKFFVHFFFLCIFFFFCLLFFCLLSRICMSNSKLLIPAPLPPTTTHKNYLGKGVQDTIYMTWWVMHVRSILQVWLKKKLGQFFNEIWGVNNCYH